MLVLSLWHHKSANHLNVYTAYTHTLHQYTQMHASTHGHIHTCTRTHTHTHTYTCTHTHMYTHTHTHMSTYKIFKFKNYTIVTNCDTEYLEIHHIQNFILLLQGWCKQSSCSGFGWTSFSQGKNKSLFLQKASVKSASVIFGLS